MVSKKNVLLNQVPALPSLFGLLALALCSPIPARAQVWIQQGPGPIIGGQDEGITSPLGNNPVAGSCTSLAASLTNPDILYVGAANGGVWKTTTATAASPTWTNLTDQALPASSINALALSPLDPNDGTIFAGTGSTSSYASDGSPGFGVARSTDGGATWQVLAVSTFANRVINSIVPTAISTGGLGGQVVLAGTLFDGGGVYRSVDGGTTFTRISGTNGLPNAGIASLVADPTNTSSFYTSVSATVGSGSAAVAGVYRSADVGQTWTAVTPLPSGLSTSYRILLSVSRTTGVLYAMEINSSGSLSAVFRSADQGLTWNSMGAPTPSIFAGGQGDIHGAVVADPTDPNAVFISGDRQGTPFTNVNGASNYSANVFRGVFATTGTVWQNCVMNGNGGGANGTSPHADSRSMAFDARANLLQTSDGGIFKLTSPNSAGNRFWSSLNSNITPTEAHSVAWDPISHTAISGNQDAGTSFQSTAGAFAWSQLIQGDGGNVAVDDDQVAHPGTSIRYVGFTGAPGYRHSFNAAGSPIGGFIPIGLNITSGPGTGLTLGGFDSSIEFYNPYVLNAIDPSRLLIGTANLYESLNKGDSLANLGSLSTNVGNFYSGNSGMAYGSRLGGVPNPGVFYVGAGTTIYHRQSDGGSLSTLGAYPGGPVRALTMDPQNYTHVFVLDTSNRIFGSFDEGVTWINLSANLGNIANLGTGASVRTIAIFSPDSTPKNTVLIAGGQGGVWQMRRPSAGGGSWISLSSGMPHALVYDLHYDYKDNVLIAGTLGRGVWTLTNFFRGGGGTGNGGGSAFHPFSPQFPVDEILDMPIGPPPVAVPNP